MALNARQNGRGGRTRIAGGIPLVALLAVGLPAIASAAGEPSTKAGNSGLVAASGMSSIQTIKPAVDDAFRWPYYLYVPPAAERRAALGARLHLLVSPNNTGQPGDSLIDHEIGALRTVTQLMRLGQELATPCLVPVFPRPAVCDSIYTHALDRDCLLTAWAGLERLDLQLLAMIEDARARLEARGWHLDERVLLTGFSASGMFANRFAVLHPDRVRAAVIGSPGGWPIAPLSEWRGEALRYPIGVADLPVLVGRSFDLETYRAVPHFFYRGEQDQEDSVVFRDGYGLADEELIGQLFGERPLDRWASAEELYRLARTEAEFHLYPGVGHEITPQMQADILRFFRKILNDDPHPGEVER